MENLINAGDIVQLKTNSIQMTVEFIDDDKAICIFWNAEKSEFERMKIHKSALIKVQ